MIRIAVISGPGIHQTWDWIIEYAKEHGQVVQEAVISKSIIKTDKAEYKVIQQRSDVNGAEFNGYLVCPTYEDLVALVRNRIKLKES